MADQSADMSGLAETELRSFVNNLMRFSLSGSSLDDITAEFERFYVEYTKRYPDAGVFALRRFQDIKLHCFGDTMSDAEKTHLYENYEAYGFDDLTTKILTLVFLHRSIGDGSMRDRADRELLAEIDSELDRGTIDETIANVPEVAARVEQHRASSSGTFPAGQ